MGKMLKNILGAVLLTMTLSSTSFAGENFNGGIIYANKFYQSVKSVKNNLIQTKTGLNESCGPTSLSFIANYFYYKKHNKPHSIFSSLRKSKYFIKKIYSNISTAGYNKVTSLDELKGVVKSYFGWKFPGTRRRNSGDQFDTNRKYLIEALRSDKVALIVLDGDYKSSPVYKEGEYFRHIVIVYAYRHRRDENNNSPLSTSNTHNNDQIYYFDPYFGKVHSITVKEIKNGALDLVNLAYLQLAVK
jgi:hypothetical protein